MKNFVVLFAFFALISLTSCSEVSDNALLTNPVLDKSNISSTVTLPSPVYPYPYLYNFSKVSGVKYVDLAEENAVECYLTDGGSKYQHVYVVATPYNDGFTRTYFIDKITENSFKINGLSLNNVSDLVVYAYTIDFAVEGIDPVFSNNSILNELVISSWKVDNTKIVVECFETWPSSLKYVFAEIQTKLGPQFVFLQKPYASKFEIPEYGKFGVNDIKLFAYNTVTEAKFVTN